MRNGHCRCGPFRVNMMPQGIIKPYILKLLSERPMHGFEIMQEIFDRSKGLWRPSTAAVYPALSQLERGGFIKKVDSDENLPEKARKEYKITEKGKEAISGFSDFKKDWADNLNSMKDFF
ncbi:MAG: PadR family transcriptional regulator [Candidatus Parvarchaeota archaeon]|nr:PadR family transcriptional regulator [Candidatus Parvarchaeota archaeon]